MQARLNKYINEVRLLEIKEIERMPFRDIETSERGKRGRAYDLEHRHMHTRTHAHIHADGSIVSLHASKKYISLTFRCFFFANF